MTFTTPEVHTPSETDLWRDLNEGGEALDAEIDRRIEQDEAPAAKAKPPRPDRDAYAAELAAAVVEAEKELARDQKALDKARAEVERLEDWVAFDQGRIESRIKSRDHFDRLRAKAAK